eukprot:2188173-Pyramimonas_sp.AAC.1
MALNPGAGIPSKKQVAGVGAPDPSRPTVLFTKAVHLGMWRIRTAQSTPRFWHCSQAGGLRKSEAEGPAGKRW